MEISSQSLNEERRSCLQMCYATPQKDIRQFQSSDQIACVFSKEERKARNNQNHPDLKRGDYVRYQAWQRLFGRS